MHQEDHQYEDSQALITCQRCGTDRPRSAYRRVANPTICLECYAAKRREAQHGTVPEVPLGTTKDRSSVYLTPHARAVLSVLALKARSDSAVIEQLLTKAYEGMGAQEKAIVAYVQHQAT